jgi:hypothetical protein
MNKAAFLGLLLLGFLFGWFGHVRYTRDALGDAAITSLTENNAVNLDGVRKDGYRAGALFGHFCARQGLTWDETQRTFESSWTNKALTQLSR